MIYDLHGCTFDCDTLVIWRFAYGLDLDIQYIDYCLNKY